MQNCCRAANGWRGFCHLGYHPSLQLVELRLANGLALVRADGLQAIMTWEKLIERNQCNRTGRHGLCIARALVRSTRKPRYGTGRRPGQAGCRREGATQANTIEEAVDAAPLILVCIDRLRNNS